jgi:hypothetical protein
MVCYHHLCCSVLVTCHYIMLKTKAETHAFRAMIPSKKGQRGMEQVEGGRRGKCPVHVSFRRTEDVSVSVFF